MWCMKAAYVRTTRKFSTEVWLWEFSRLKILTQTCLAFVDGDLNRGSRLRSRGLSWWPGFQIKLDVSVWSVQSTCGSHEDLYWNQERGLANMIFIFTRHMNQHWLLSKSFVLSYMKTLFVWFIVDFVPIVWCSEILTWMPFLSPPLCPSSQVCHAS